jgi:2,4-dienoyl-CoA reductase (NADPH2)
MVSMARPLLADPDFVVKAQAGQSNRINTCIACNQACLDHVFKKKTASCLVNPRACHETRLVPKPLIKRKKIAIVGAGPAGLACAVAASARGHQVTLFDKDNTIGGQFNLAKTIPGKEEFHETLRYFENELTTHKVSLRLNTTVTEAQLDPKVFSEIVIATGVYPRQPKIPGIEHPSVKSYLDVLRDPEAIGSKVAIIGAGGIGFDIAALLLHGQHKTSTNVKAFYHYWGIDTKVQAAGGLLKKTTLQTAPIRNITLLQRRQGKMGKNLGKTTGWIHREMLKRAQVTQLDGVSYTRIDDQGLHITRQQKEQVLAVDHLIICAGQHSKNTLSHQLNTTQIPHHLIGGAYEVKELDAKFAIQQGMSLGDTL